MFRNTSTAEAQRLATSGQGSYFPASSYMPAIGAELGPRSPVSPSASPRLPQTGMATLDSDRSPTHTLPSPSEIRFPLSGESRLATADGDAGGVAEILRILTAPLRNEPWLEATGPSVSTRFGFIRPMWIEPTDRLLSVPWLLPRPSTLSDLRGCIVDRLLLGGKSDVNVSHGEVLDEMTLLSKATIAQLESDTATDVEALELAVLFWNVEAMLRMAANPPTARRTYLGERVKCTAYDALSRAERLCSDALANAPADSFRDLIFLRHVTSANLCSYYYKKRKFAIAHKYASRLMRPARGAWLPGALRAIGASNTAVLYHAEGKNERAVEASLLAVELLTEHAQAALQGPTLGSSLLAIEGAAAFYNVASIYVALLQPELAARFATKAMECAAHAKVHGLPGLSHAERILTVSARVHELALDATAGSPRRAGGLAYKPGFESAPRRATGGNRMARGAGVAESFHSCRGGTPRVATSGHPEFYTPRPPSDGRVEALEARANRSDAASDIETCGSLVRHRGLTSQPRMPATPTSPPRRTQCGLAVEDVDRMAEHFESERAAKAQRWAHGARGTIHRLRDELTLSTYGPQGRSIPNDDAPTSARCTAARDPVERYFSTRLPPEAPISLCAGVGGWWPEFNTPRTARKPKPAVARTPTRQKRGEIPSDLVLSSRFYRISDLKHIGSVTEEQLFGAAGANPCSAAGGPGPNPYKQKDMRMWFTPPHIAAEDRKSWSARGEIRGDRGSEICWPGEAEGTTPLPYSSYSARGTARSTGNLETARSTGEFGLGSEQRPSKRSSKEAVRMHPVPPPRAASRDTDTLSWPGMQPNPINEAGGPTKIGR